MPGSEGTLKWVLPALVLVALLLALGVLAWRGCSKTVDPLKKQDPSRQQAETPPQPQAQETAKEPPACDASAKSHGPPGEAGQAATESHTEIQDESQRGAQGGPSGPGNGHAKPPSSADKSAQAQPGGGTGGQSSTEKPASNTPGRGGLPGMGTGFPAEKATSPAAGGQGPGGDPAAAVGLSPQQLAQAVAAARDAAAKARQWAERGNPRQAYQAALAGWERIRGLARFDKEAAAAAGELFNLLQQYGKTLEADTQPPGPTDTTPLITR